MTADLRDMDNSLSASTITEDPAKPPLCTYLLPATAESDLPISTRLKFAKDTVLARLNLGEKSAAQLAEEDLERTREKERQMRMEARNKMGGDQSLLEMAIGGAGGGGGGGGMLMASSSSAQRGR